MMTPNHNIAAKMSFFFFVFVNLEKRRRHSTPMEAGRSHTASADDVAVFDPTTLFDSFESELHPLEHPSTPKSKKNREGDNPRVRSKDARGVFYFESSCFLFPS